MQNTYSSSSRLFIHVSVPCWSTFQENQYAESCKTIAHALNLSGVKGSYSARKIKFSIKDFFNKCDQIRSFLRIWHIYWRNP